MLDRKRGSYRKGALTKINSSGIIFWAIAGRSGKSPEALTEENCSNYFGNHCAGGGGGGVIGWGADPPKPNLVKYGQGPFDYDKGEKSAISGSRFEFQESVQLHCNN